MRCAQVARHAERFVDEALDVGRARQIETHLLSCAQCRARVDAARALLRGFSAPAEGAPRGFAFRVMEAVYREALAGGPRASAPETLETRPFRPPARFYRRLGLSLVLTAGVLAASLFVPHAAYPGLLGLGSEAGGLSWETSAAMTRGFGAAVQSALNGADSVVRGILREQANGGSIQ